MKEINTSDLNNLKELSQYLGNNLDWVQGAGGNTSVKDDQNIFVKSSGYWLSDAKNTNIFSQLNLKILFDLINNAEEDLTSAQIYNDEKERLRPSIETSLHALMPHRYVIHIHSTNIIANAVFNDCKKHLNKKLEGLNWQLIPYVRPGLPLTNMLIKLNAFNFDVLILANHGVVIGADSKKDVVELLLRIEEKLFKPIREVPSVPDLAKLEDLIKSSKYKLPKYDFCQKLAMDKISHKILAKSPLYPDHVIFLGPGAIPVLSEDKFSLKLLQDNDDLHSKVIVIKGVGVITHNDLSLNAEEMLHCLTSVLLKIDNHDDLNHLSSQDEMQLLGWDAEKYRKTIER